MKRAVFETQVVLVRRQTHVTCGTCLVKSKGKELLPQPRCEVVRLEDVKSAMLLASSPDFLHR